MTTGNAMGTDKVLLYDVEPWSLYGFGVANFGDNVGTLSTPIHRLTDEIGRHQLLIMTHVDAQRTKWPSRNTVERLGKMINRVKSILASRQKAASEVRVEGGHYTSTVTPWNIHPVPFFPSAFVRNAWLREYNELVMIALTNAYQHSDNNIPLTITQEFAEQVWQYFREVQRYVGIELLGLAPAIVEVPEFKFETVHYDAYSPEDFTTNFERLDTPGPIQSTPTEDDLRALYVGIPASEIVPLLKQWYVGVNDLGRSGTEIPDEAQTRGVADGSGVAPAGGTIGEPQM